LFTAYRSIGLGQRITEGDGTDTEYLTYDDRWRLISRHDGSEYTEEVVHHAAGLDGFGGASDVDSVIMRRTFLTTGSPQTEDNRYYILQNWRQDPAVTITDAGVQVERAHFSPYGRVLGMPAGHTDFDFAFDSDDQTTLSGWSGAYRAHADVDLDGDVDSDDATANTSVTMGWDVLSSVGSKVGYAGYVQDAYVPTVYHVRYRVLKVDLGRWLQRDPAGYVDGANLYEYVMSQPVEMRDSMGLASRVGFRKTCGSDAKVMATYVANLRAAAGNGPTGTPGEPRYPVPIWPSDPTVPEDPAVTPIRINPVFTPPKSIYIDGEGGQQGNPCAWGFGLPGWEWGVVSVEVNYVRGTACVDCDGPAWKHNISFHGGGGFWRADIRDFGLSTWKEPSEPCSDGSCICGTYCAQWNGRIEVVFISGSIWGVVSSLNVSCTVCMSCLED